MYIIYNIYNIVNDKTGRLDENYSDDDIVLG